MKTGIYGGTFNPIHNGHLHIVEEFRRGLGLDRVLLIPTRVPPHKAAPDLASAGERFAMCRLAAQRDARHRVLFLRGLLGSAHHHLWGNRADEENQPVRAAQLPL